MCVKVTAAMVWKTRRTIALQRLLDRLPSLLLAGTIQSRGKMLLTSCTWQSDCLTHGRIGTGDRARNLLGACFFPGTHMGIVSGANAEKKKEGTPVKMHASAGIS